MFPAFLKAPLPEPVSEIHTLRHANPSPVLYVDSQTELTELHRSISMESDITQFHMHMSAERPRESWSNLTLSYKVHEKSVHLITVFGSPCTQHACSALLTTSNVVLQCGASQFRSSLIACGSIVGCRSSTVSTSQDCLVFGTELLWCPQFIPICVGIVEYTTVLATPATARRSLWVSYSSTNNDKREVSHSGFLLQAKAALV